MDNNTSHITKLRAITAELPSLDTLVERRGQTHIEYAVEDGFCVGTGLWESKNVVVQRNVMSKGSCFETHEHDQSEIIIIVSGTLKANEQIYSAGEIIRFEPNVPHSVYAIESTEMIAILIPWGKGYPNAR